SPSLLLQFTGALNLAMSGSATEDNALEGSGVLTGSMSGGSPGLLGTVTTPGQLTGVYIRVGVYFQGFMSGQLCVSGRCGSVGLTLEALFTPTNGNGVTTAINGAALSGTFTVTSLTQFTASSNSPPSVPTQVSPAAGKVFSLGE